MANRPEQSLMSHLIVIVASVICGFGVWLVVQFTETEEINLNVEVIPVGVDPTVNLNLRSREVIVRFSYPAVESTKMRSENFYIEMDFSDLKESLARKLEDSGERPVYEEMVKSRFRADELSITPISVIRRQVKWEANLRSTLARVRPRVVGLPAEGFIYDPERALVEGGADTVRILMHEWKQEEFRAAGVETPVLYTEPIDVSGASDYVSAQAKIVYPEGTEPLPGEEDLLLNVIVEIREETVTRRLQQLPINYEFVSSGKGLEATVSPSRINVVLTGKRSVVLRVRPEDIRFTLFGVTERAGETTEVPVDPVLIDYDLRQSIDSLVAEPRTASVTVSAVPGAEPTPTPTPTPEAGITFSDDVETSPDLQALPEPSLEPPQP